jgi:2-amino-4-hydroxy-6-hydroxymethyldihydropteridine diphosphokinase/dihydropteroate synthase
LVILGLGSNVGDRLGHLRLALKLIKKIPQLIVKQVSPVYLSDALLPKNAPSEWNMPHLNVAIRLETSLTPPELLKHTQHIEQQLGRKEKAHWGPRIIDIDLLAWDEMIYADDHLQIPHPHLTERPFALWPLADVAPRWINPTGPWQGKTASEIVTQWGSRFSSEAPLHTRQIQQRIDTPEIMGIINLTPDSFSDDGKLDNEESAWQYVQKMVEEGADILDFGAEATGPTAISLDPQEEWQRLAPLLTKTLDEKSNFLVPPKISIDTRHAKVAAQALALGVDWINDVSGLMDPAMCEVVANSQCDLVFMHHLDVPVNKKNHLPLDQDPVALIYQWAEKRLTDLEKRGIQRERLIFDPGIGYGKTAEQSLEIIKNIKKLHLLGIRILVGHSRKSFLSQFTPLPPSERDIETLIVTLELAKQEVDYVRVHNIPVTARGLKLFKTF